MWVSWGRNVLVNITSFIAQEAINGFVDVVEAFTLVARDFVEFIQGFGN